MKLLHTSDWHLGRTLHGESLIDYQRTFLAWLVDLAVERPVDAVLVAGDIYDRAVPSTDAVLLLDQVLSRLVEAGVPVLFTSGNHDSAVRLGFGSRVQRAAGVHVHTAVADIDRPMILADDAGQVAVYGIPYMFPDAVMVELDAERSHESVLSAAVQRIRADAAERGIDRVVALAHAFITGGAASDSERDIRVGGVADAPARVFSGLTYTALGHLHGAQQVAPRVRYSGSPLAFSFSEKDHRKSVTIVDIAADGEVAVEQVPVPVERALAEIRGRIDDLVALDRPELETAWVRAILTDPRRPPAPMERLRQRFPHTIALDFAPDGEQIDVDRDLARIKQTVDPLDMCAHFVEWVDTEPPDERQSAVLQSVVESVQHVEVGA